MYRSRDEGGYHFFDRRNVHILAGVRDIPIFDVRSSPSGFVLDDHVRECLEVTPQTYTFH